VQKNCSHIIKRIALLMIVPAIIMAFVAANYFNQSNVCKDVKVNIVNQQEFSFVTEADVKEMLVNEKNILIGKTKVKDIHIQQLEAIAKNNPWVADANIFVDIHHVVHVDVTQRIPVLRWLNGDLIQNYLDDSCNAIAVNDRYSANVPVVTSSNKASGVALFHLKQQMVELCKYIKNDSFWNAMVTQVNVTNNNQFELVPAIGDHIIAFGDTTNMRNKFARLYLFYKDVLPRNGWNAYEKISVAFDGQIVAQRMDSIKQINLAKHIYASAKPTVTLDANITDRAAQAIRNQQQSKSASTSTLPKQNASKPNASKIVPKAKVQNPKTPLPKPTSKKVEPKPKKAIVSPSNQNKKPITKQ
jgi:cell division protein FtsQ